MLGWPRQLSNLAVPRPGRHPPDVQGAPIWYSENMRNPKRKNRIERRRALENQRIKAGAQSGSVYVITRQELRDEGFRLEKYMPVAKLGELFKSVCKTNIPAEKDEGSFVIVVETLITQADCDAAMSIANKLLEDNCIHWRMRDCWVRADVSPRRRTFFKCTPVGLEDLVGRVVDPLVEEWVLRPGSLSGRLPWEGTHRVPDRYPRLDAREPVKQGFHNLPTEKPTGRSAYAKSAAAPMHNIRKR